MQRITERRDNIVIIDRVWPRLLSSTNQPRFIDVEVSNEEGNEKKKLIGPVSRWSLFGRHFG